MMDGSALPQTLLFSSTDHAGMDKETIKQAFSWKYLPPLILTNFILLLMVIASASPWYFNHYGGRDQTEYLTYMAAHGAECNYTENDCVSEGLRDLYTAIRALVVLGTLQCLPIVIVLVCFFVQWLDHFKWRKFLYRLLLGVMTSAVLLSFLSWTIFAAHTAVVRPEGSCNGNPEQEACKFRQSKDFGPGPGWVLYIGIFVLTAVDLGLVIAAGLPNSQSFISCTCADKNQTRLQ